MSCFSQWDIGACGCVTTCNVHFMVQGCGSLGLPGATVNIWTSSAKTTLIATGTTDSTGHVTLDVGAAGTYYVETVTNTTRLNPPAPGFLTMGCNGAGTFNLVTTNAAGFSGCLTGCPIPAANTLHDTRSAAAMTWNGTVWSSISEQLFPNGTLSLAGGETCTGTITSCPPSLSISITACTSGSPNSTITE